MTGSRVWKIFSGTLLILFFAAINAHAAEEGGGATTERAKEIFKWINFAIVAGLLAWVFLKLTPPFFRKNAETISSAISKATAAKAAAGLAAPPSPCLHCRQYSPQGSRPPGAAARA